MLSLLKLIGRPLFKILFSVEYHGLQNVPERGPVILAGNHPSYLDPALVSLPVNRVIKFMAWDALFKVPLLGRLIEALGAFPVDIQKGRGEAAYREALRVLESGAALGIFPEGQRSEQGPMGALRSGVARLAIESGAPIVPITIGGASRAWPRWRLLPRPAKIIVRYHKPIHLDQAERDARRDDRGFQQEVIARVTASINRSLAPALRGAAQWEKWYQQPPSHIRSYEWAPLFVALIATALVYGRGASGDDWLKVWLPVAIYYIYIAVDLMLIGPGRLAKWLRNSMPIWLILAWHHWLTEAARLPAGGLNALLVGAALAAFFTFFWEDYYTLQKFVRGLVVVYYCSLALLIGWPHPLGLLVAALGFIAVFALWHRTVYHRATAAVMILSIIAAIFLIGPASLSLLAYAALGVAALGYLQTFVRAAYDIRKAGQVTIQNSADAARP
jgi:1-acyl-sn-glycerol-3-phosphate acyltransferase